VTMIKPWELVMSEAVLSILGDIQNPMGHSTEQPALGDPA